MSLTDKLQELQAEALADVDQGIARVREATEALDAAKAALREAVQVAVRTGADVGDVAKRAGYSASTVGAWARGSKAPPADQEQLPDTDEGAMAPMAEGE